jgi:regulator of protease activity HflC (stomatin/prohibitin superfamily)
MGYKMKKILLLTFSTAALSLNACSYVEPGYVGILVNKLGSDKGVNGKEVPVGRYWVGMNEELYTFPTFAQTETWSGKDAFNFQTKEGLNVTAELGITYAIDPDKVSVVFQKYRKGIEEITHIYLHNMVRDALVTEASTRPIESVYGEGKAALIEAVQSRVVSETKEIGINIEKIYLVGNLGLPDAVTAAINAKIGATQKAAQRENEVAQSKAEADKLVAEARGRADSTLLEAEAEAKAIKIKGDALSQNPKLVELSAVEKWNGVLPEYMFGQSTPFINIK